MAGEGAMVRIPVAVWAPLAVGAAIVVVSALTVRIRGRRVVERHPPSGDGSMRAQRGSEDVVVIVPGARVFPDGRLSLTLLGRLDTAHELYRAGRAHSFLVSGANDLPEFGEAAVMRQHLQARGVPADAIIADEAGVSTWATVQRAREVFGVERALFVTQHPYADRAGTLGRAAGLDLTVVSIDPPPVRRRRWIRVRAREALANIKACAIAVSRWR